MIDIDAGRRLLDAFNASVSDGTFRNPRYLARLAWGKWTRDNAAALLSELEAARRDAGRYRWLRERPQMMAQLGRAEHTIRLDAAIDAAMRVTPGK